jgi:hypothetical protein
MSIKLTTNGYIVRCEKEIMVRLFEFLEWLLEDQCWRTKKHKNREY